MAGQVETLALALSEGDIKAALDLLRGRSPNFGRLITSRNRPSLTRL